MNKISFEWDSTKSKTNIKKHGISFEEATTVFYDDEHSEWEDRFLMLGLSDRLNLLLVCHCYREANNKIRIISARKVTKNESKY
jgi:uncharacterized DUF497 family protein